MMSSALGMMRERHIANRLDRRVPTVLPDRRENRPLLPITVPMDEGPLSTWKGIPNANYDVGRILLDGPRRR
jgi:hypothetical protein